MRRAHVFSLSVCVLGLLLLTVPLHIFPVCEVREGMDPMRCYWSGWLLAGSGATFFLLGILVSVFRTPKARMAVGTVMIAVAALTALTPTWLVGMCKSAMMPCRTGTLPAAMIIAGIMVLEGIFLIVYLKYTGSRERHAYDTSHNLAYRPE